MDNERPDGNRVVLLLVEVDRLVKDFADGAFPLVRPGETLSEAYLRRVAELEPRLARIEYLRTCVRARS
jgi:hypothetical protein